MKITLLSSNCTKLDAYERLVQLVVDDLGVAVNIEKSVAKDDLRKYGILDGCGYHYCAGCNRPNRVQKENFYTPAMVINDKVVIHSCFPKKEDVRYNILYSQMYDKELVPVVDVHDVSSEPCN